MITEIDKETLDFICATKLTFNQFAICLMVAKGDKAALIRLGEEVGLIGDCLIKVGKDKYLNEVEDLEKKGYLINTFVDKNDYFALDNFKVSDKFLKQVTEPLASAAKEFFDAYPRRILVKGVEYPARSCDFDELEEKYLKAINNSIKKHRAVIAKMQAYTETTPYATLNIMNFVGARGWDDLKASTTKSKLV